MELYSIPERQTQAQASQVMVNSFIQSVYNWMAIGLALTGFTAYSVAHSEALIALIFGTPLFYGMIIGELALVWILSARVGKMQASTATIMFLGYSALNGATLSAIFLVYAASSIASVFFVCSGTFVACSVYGMTTKRDLTSMGSFMMMGLFGIIIASVVNLFVRSSAVSMITSYIGVLVFVGLTAYDTQKIRTMAMTQPDDLGSAAVHKGAIIGALNLYLDFVNLFLMLLRIFGGSRD